MPIVIISSDTYQTGRRIGEMTAKETGYDYVDRDILPPVAELAGTPEEKLVRALDEPPSFLGLSSKLRGKVLAHIEEATLGHLLEDNVVCHGLCAHLYVLGVSHILKVRVLSNPGDFVREVSAQQNTSPEKVMKLLKKQESERKRWTLGTFGVDETDPSNYDLVINLNQIDPDEAVQTIARMTTYRKFKPMTYSIKCLRDKELACRVRVALMEDFPDVKVQADGTTVIVDTKTVKREKRKRVEAIKALANRVVGVSYVEVHVVTDILRQATKAQDKVNV